MGLSPDDVVGRWSNEMHHEDRDAHQRMVEGVDSQANWDWAKSVAKSYDERAKEGDWSWAPWKQTDDMRTYYGNDPIDVVELYPPTVAELMERQAKQRADEWAILAIFSAMVTLILLSPRIWHWITFVVRLFV